LRPVVPQRHAHLLAISVALFSACSSSSTSTSTDGGDADASAATQDGTMAGNDLSTQGGDGSMVPGPDGATAPGPHDFLSNAPWYQDISAASTASYSSTVIAHLATASWGTLGIDVSFAILDANASVARRAYTLNGSYYDPDCDHAPVPLPPGGAIENYPLNGYACGGGDCHLIVFQGTRLYELGVANVAGGQFDGSPFTGGCLAIWDLTHDYWAPGATPYARGEQCTSADAAGFPMAPLILTAADLASGEIKHALRFTLSNSLIRASSYVHPATHGTSASGGGASGGSNTMPYGSRLRLKPGAYPGIGAQGQIVVKALQKYGMFMSDGGNLYISGAADLIGVIGGGALGSLTANDFEVIDSGAPIAWNGNCTRTPLTN